MHALVPLHDAELGNVVVVALAVFVVPAPVAVVCLGRLREQEQPLSACSLCFAATWAKAFSTWARFLPPPPPLRSTSAVGRIFAKCNNNKDVCVWKRPPRHVTGVCGVRRHHGQRREKEEEE